MLRRPSAFGDICSSLCLRQLNHSVVARMNSKSGLSSLTIGVVLVAALVALPSYDPAVEFSSISRTNHQTAATQPVDTQEYTREILYFPCSGLNCEAWLYMPKSCGVERPPVVILGHGKLLGLGACYACGRQPACLYPKLGLRKLTKC